MSSVGNSTVEKMFFCYECNRTVTISISSSSDDPFCPLCAGGFLEEIDEPPPNPNLNPSAGFLPMADPFSTLLPLLFGSSSSSAPRSTENQPPGAFDPVSFLQNHLQHLQSSGTHVQFLIGDHPTSDPFSRIPGNAGDYFFGPGLEQLIQQLAENDPNRYGTPPASKSAIEALPTVKVTVEMLSSEMNQCAVCMDEFEEGGDVKQMPCKHVFHEGCLMPWLELHNSCPVCRFELPTDDADYERRGQGQGGMMMSGQGSGEGQQTAARRFSVQLPWLFGSQDGSGSGSGGRGSGGGGGGSNLETRQEDLD